MTNTNESIENQPLENEISEISPEMQAFFQRADSFIQLANSQLSPEAHTAQVSASLMYSSARYSASVASIGFSNADDFVKEKQQIIDFYSKQFSQMLSDNLDDYARNFDNYAKLNADNTK